MGDLDLKGPGGFLLLPTELILLVGGFLEYHSDVNALSRISRDFYNLLNPVLYDRIASSGDRHALTWAVRHGVEAAARKAIFAGITPTLDDVKIAIGEDNERMVELLCKELALDQEGDDEPWRLSALAEIAKPAASRGNKSMAQLLISYGANPQTVNQPNSGLLNAASCGDIQAAETLVEAGANVNTLEHGRNTPLKGAAENGHLQMVKWLLEHGAEPNVYCYHPYFDHTPLEFALLGGHLDVARMLLDHGAEVRTSMLGGAVSYEHSSAAELLLERLRLEPSQMDKGEQDKLGCVAASFGFIDVLTNLVTQGWSVETDQIVQFPGFPVTPLMFAARKGQVRAVRFLMSHGAKDSSRGSALFDALAEGHEGIVRILLEDLTDELPTHYVSLFEVCGMRNNTILQLLLDRKVPLDPEVMPKILPRMRPEHVQMFVEAGYNIIDDPTLLGENNSLLELVKDCQKEVLNALVQHGFHPHPENDDHEKQSILQAIKRQNLDLLHLLISHGFNVRRPEWQASFLECAASIGGSAVETVDLLLAESLDIEALDENHATPLLRLVSTSMPSRFLNGVQILLERGANPCYESPSGECPLTAASGHPENSSVTKALLEYIDKRNDIPSSVVISQLLRAIPKVVEEWRAPFGEKKKVLTQYYWRKKYPVPT